MRKYEKIKIFMFGVISVLLFMVLIAASGKDDSVLELRSLVLLDDHGNPGLMISSRSIQFLNNEMYVRVHLGYDQEDNEGSLLFNDPTGPRIRLGLKEIPALEMFAADGSGELIDCLPR